MDGGSTRSAMRGLDPPNKRAGLAGPRTRAQQIWRIAMTGGVLLRWVPPLKTGFGLLAVGLIFGKNSASRICWRTSGTGRPVDRCDIGRPPSACSTCMCRARSRGNKNSRAKTFASQFTPLARAVIFHFLQPDRSKELGRTRWVDVAGAATARHRMDGDVADLMADKKRAIRVRALVFRTDRTGSAGRKPHGHH